MRWLSILACLLAACGSGDGDSLELDTVLVSTQHDFDNTGRPTFVFAATLSDASFLCRLDGAEDTVVGDRITLAGLEDGPHRMDVAAFLPDGTIDETPLVLEWTQDTEPPAMAITFPPPISGTDRDVVAVCGTASDGLGIASVSVNGVEAHIADGTWRAEVPVITSRALEVVCRDRAGNEVRETGPVVVALGERSSLYDAVAWDAARARPLAIAPNACYALGGAGPEPVGSGLLDPVLIEEHPTRDTALVFDAHECRLFEIDLGTGDTVLYPVAGADITADTSGLMTTDGKEAFVQGPVKVPLVGVDLKTGATRDVLAGDWATQPTGMAYDAGRDRILVVEAADDTVVAIDPATGAMSVASAPSLAPGSTLGTKRGLVVDGDAAYALGNGGAWIVRIDLATGARTTTRIATPITGARDIALDAAGNRLVVADADADGVTRVDLATGAVTREAPKLVPLGTGPRIGRPDAVFCDADRLRLIVMDRDPKQLVAIDLATADREKLHAMPPDALRMDLVPDDGGAVAIAVGFRVLEIDALGATTAETAFDTVVRGIAYDAMRDTTVVTTSDRIHAGGTIEILRINTLPESLQPPLEATNGVMAFHDGTLYFAARDKKTGDGSVLARNAEGEIRAVTGVWMKGPLHIGGKLDAAPDAIAVDAKRGRLLIARTDREELHAVDLASGARTLLSGKKRGVGPRLTLPRSIGVDGDLAFVATANGVVAVDLVSGDRVLMNG